MKSVENILGYIQQKGCKPRENLWIVQETTLFRMFKTDSFFRQKKIEFKPECLAWSCHFATGCFVAFFGWYFYIEIRLKYETIILLSSSRAFSFSIPMENSAVCQLCHCLLHLFCCLPMWKTMRLHGKKLQNATNTFRSDFNPLCLATATRLFFRDDWLHVIGEGVNQWIYPFISST